MYQEKLIKNKVKQIDKILSILNKCKISSDNHESSKEPFFSSSKNIEDFKVDYKHINKKIPESLNRNIKIIYELLGDNYREIYIGDWTIMSINESIKRYEEYCKNGQNKVFDIGYKYLGLGHIELISCDLETHLLFFRHDGGSNGLDRELNFNRVINEGASNYRKFYFSEWFYNTLNSIN